MKKKRNYYGQHRPFCLLQRFLQAAQSFKMGKILSLILITVLLSSVFAGCAAKETQTEDNPKAETDAGQQQEESNTMDVLQGTIIPDSIPLGTGMLLDKPITVDGRQVDKVYFNEDKVTDLVPRTYFTYYFEGGTSIDADKYSGTISAKVEIVKDSYRYDEGLAATYADIADVISVDGEQEPGDKTKDEYPLDYYKNVFYVFCNKNYGVAPADVKETYYYTHTDDDYVGYLYKRAVDKILEAGLFINMSEGQYYIEEEDKSYNEEESNEGTIYKVEDLSVGDQVAGMTIRELEYIGNDRLNIMFDGYTVVVGSITYTYSEMYDEYVLGLEIQDPYLLNENIEVTFSDGPSDTFTYNLFSAYFEISNKDYFTKEQLDELKAGKRIEGKIELDGISHSAKFHSEGGTSAHIKGLLDTTVVD